MAKTTSAEAGCSSVATGEKRTHLTQVSGRQASPTDQRCDLCALLRQYSKSPNPRHSSPSSRHGLRIALVDGDEQTRMAVSQMARTQRAGWALEVYHPSCPVGETSAGKGSARPKPLEGHRGCGNVPDIVLICPPGDGRSRLACVRKLKALAPGLPVLIISGDSAEASIAECCVAGADGYVLKPLPSEELARAIGSVAQGCPVLCRDAQKAILNFLHRQPRPQQTGSRPD